MSFFGNKPRQNLKMRKPKIQLYSLSFFPFPSLPFPSSYVPSYLPTQFTYLLTYQPFLYSKINTQFTKTLSIATVCIFSLVVQAFILVCCAFLYIQKIIIKKRIQKLWWTQYRSFLIFNFFFSTFFFGFPEVIVFGRAFKVCQFQWCWEFGAFVLVTCRWCNTCTVLWLQKRRQYEGINNSGTSSE